MTSFGYRIKKYIEQELSYRKLISENVQISQSSTEQW